MFGEIGNNLSSLGGGVAEGDGGGFIQKSITRPHPPYGHPRQRGTTVRLLYLDIFSDNY